MTTNITNFPRGSEWRKWDLHVHTPETKCSDCYKLEGEVDVWDEFCTRIHESDVEAIGITDYFSLDNFFKFKEKYYAKFPQSAKAFFPNMELRLNESVNSAQEEVNIHLVFRPDLTEDDAKDFVNALKTIESDGRGRDVACSQLSVSHGGRNDFEAATVTRQNIDNAIKEVFGKKIVRQDYLMIVAATNNDGIRPVRGKKRKLILTDEIDKFCDAFFGGSQNVEQFLDSKRLEDKEQKVAPKPVLAGCDAHSFIDLEVWLGQTVRDESTHKETTWIKADLTYEGLQQILVEPSERIHIQAIKPDEKEGYKVIDKVVFEGTDDFPSEVVFNSNLCSIIGSRSSGKSALLNYIAHVVDPEYVEGKVNVSGPAAKIKWDDMTFSCKVYWSDGGVNDAGKIVFLPQGYLSKISDQPEVITEKIMPVLFKKYPSVETQYRAAVSRVTSGSLAIETSLGRWFALMSTTQKMEATIKLLGDKDAIKAAIETYEKKLKEEKEKAKLTEEELTSYKTASSQLSINEALLKDLLNSEGDISTNYYIGDTASDFEFDIVSRPSLDNLPDELKHKIELDILTMKGSMSDKIKKTISEYYNGLLKKIQAVKEETGKLQADNKPLFEKYEQNAYLVKQVEELNKQKQVLKSIGEQEVKLKVLKEKLETELVIIGDSLVARDEAYEDLEVAFQDLDQTDASMEFNVECSLESIGLARISSEYNQRETKGNQFLSDDRLLNIDVKKVRREYREYLLGLFFGKIKLKQGAISQQVAIDTLTLTEGVRFSAIMEGDSIGGFSESSMTPGKQALFALTLVLDESNDSWPLLIDQPEDDLDSRSIYDRIAKFFREKKKERQIIMVSHNANLVIGADSEQILVANKHGDDRKNHDNQLFEYFTGSLENTLERQETDIVLESCGIREHACDILDGGEEAFYKREQKYKLSKKES